MHTFTVRLVDRSGKPAKGRRVSVHHGWMGVIGPLRTNEKGEAHFEHKPVCGRASIDGRRRDEVIDFRGLVVIHL